MLQRTRQPPRHHSNSGVQLVCRPELRWTSVLGPTWNVTWKVRSTYGYFLSAEKERIPITLSHRTLFAPVSVGPDSVSFPHLSQTLPHHVRQQGSIFSNKRAPSTHLGIDGRIFRNPEEHGRPHHFPSNKRVFRDGSWSDLETPPNKKHQRSC